MSRPLPSLVLCSLVVACRASQPSPPATAQPVVAAVAPVDAPPAAPAATATAPCRSALPFTAAPEAAPAPPPAPTDPVVLRACEAAVRPARARLAALLRPLAPDARAPIVDELTRCLGAGAGAWAFVIDRAETARNDAELTFTIHVRPVYVAPGGAMRRAGVALRIAAGTSSFVHSIEHRDVGVFDWDGDGRGELYFREEHSQHENGNAVARLDRAWTFAARGAEVREYAPEAARATAIRDVDSDGRPDLLLRSPWVDVGPCGIDDVDYPGPRLLLHSRPDGTFSADDEGAQGFVAHQCRERPAALISVPAGGGEMATADEPSYRIACARWWGRTAADVADEVTRTYPETPDGGDEPLRCFPRAELLRLAAVDPPQAFRLTCGDAH